MEPVSILDLIILAALAVPVLTVRLGPLRCLWLILYSAPFFYVQLPALLVYERMLCAWDQQSQYGRRVPVFDLACVTSLRWALNHLDATVTGALFCRPLAETLFQWRRFRSGGAQLGDTAYQRVRTSTVRGFWVKSPFRGGVHDLVVYFVPGAGYLNASSYTYLEFSMLFLRSLQLSGFRNPLIFVLDYPRAPTKRYIDQLRAVASGWQFLNSQFSLHNTAIVADSTAATLVLGMLLHLARPSPQVDVEFGEEPPRPGAVLLVSPWPSMFSGHADTWNQAPGASGDDYLTSTCLKAYVKRYLDPQDSPEATDVYQSPLYCRSRQWWAEAYPTHGMYITYGRLETLAPAIEELYVVLKATDAGYVELDGRADEVHNWPFVRCALGESSAEREVGVDTLSNRLAKMMLWHAHNFRVPDTTTTATATAAVALA